MSRYNVTIPAGTSTTVYVPVYEEDGVIILGGKATVSGTPGATSSVAVYADTTLVGTCTLASGAAAGSNTAVTMSTTLATRKTVAEDAIKLVFTSTSSVAMGLTLDCDEALRTTD